MNASLSVSTESLRRGIATHSSGNHAQAVACAAKALGTRAFVVMPNNSPTVKVNAVLGYGAEVTFCEPNQAARENALQIILDATGAEFIHPYDDFRVITGQATCAKELIEDESHLDVLIAPVGGGGLLSGVCLSAHYWLPDALIYAAEPMGAADAVLSLKSGRVERAPYVDTIADGLLTTLCQKTLAIIGKFASEILLVSDDDIKSSMRLIYERMKLVVEPSSAVALAAILKNKDKFAGKKVGVILSGGNVDLSKFGDWFKN
jgi:threonine dehydratase